MCDLCRCVDVYECPCLDTYLMLSRFQIYEWLPEIEGKDCSKEDDEVAEELDSDAQPPVGHVADENCNEEGKLCFSIDLSIHSIIQSTCST